MPSEAIAKLAIAVVLEMLWNQGKGSLDQKLKAALWLMDSLEDTEP